MEVSNAHGWKFAPRVGNGIRERRLNAISHSHILFIYEYVFLRQCYCVCDIKGNVRHKCRKCSTQAKLSTFLNTFRY
uniref:Uncharacterized protein n=1 Tax=Megaselia scalaris TaxID=36166 RepID=T1H1W2_MEGSC